MSYIDNSHFMFQFENEIWNSGIKNIAGTDEVGRGPLAGPVVAAAVVIPNNLLFPPVKDSKKISDKQRRELRSEILKVSGIKYAIAEVSVTEIDQFNILKAAQLAMKKAVEQILDVEFVLIDGLPIKDFPISSKAIVGGDAKSASIAAASILAKVYRDDLMAKYDLQYPEYGFGKNKGYGTTSHLDAIKKHGPCPIHRRSFTPIKEMVENKSIQGYLF